MRDSTSPHPHPHPLHLPSQDRITATTLAPAAPKARRPPSQQGGGSRTLPTAAMGHASARCRSLPLALALLTLALLALCLQAGAEPTPPPTPASDGPVVRMFFSYPFTESIALDPEATIALLFRDSLRSTIAVTVNMSASNVDDIALYAGTSAVDVRLTTAEAAHTLRTYIRMHGLCLLSDTQMCGFTALVEGDGEVELEEDDGGSGSGGSSLPIPVSLLVVAIVGLLAVIIMLFFFVRQVKARRHRVRHNLVLRTAKSQWSREGYVRDDVFPPVTHLSSLPPCHLTPHNCTFPFSPPFAAGSGKSTPQTRTRTRTSKLKAMLHRPPARRRHQSPGPHPSDAQALPRCQGRSLRPRRQRLAHLQGARPRTQRGPPQHR